MLYHHGFDVELPYPPPLTRSKLLAPSCGILSLHIKSTSNHIKSYFVQIICNSQDAASPGGGGGYSN